MGLFGEKNAYAGLDIGEHSAKIMELKKTGAGYEIVDFGIVPTPKGLIDGGVITDEQNAVTTLQALAGSIRAKSPRVALAVSGDSVIVRSLTLPVMPDNELAEAVRYEAEAVIPIPAKDVTIDFIKYDVTADGDVKKQDILVIAVRNDIIEKMINQPDAVGFEPKVIDVEPLVLQRAVKALNSQMIPGDGCYAIVNIGSSTTNISVFDKDRLAFTRTLGFGGNKLSISLVNHRKISAEEAESVKKMIDLKAVTEETEIFLPVINELVTEIGRSLEYYLAQHRGQRISQVVITGGSAQIKGLGPFMSDGIDAPVTVFNPVDYLKISGKVKNVAREIEDAGTALTKVVGLALSEVV